MSQFEVPMSHKLSPFALIRARVRDIQPNKPKPTLELYFDNDAHAHLPSEHKGELVLHLHGTQWRGTIGLTPPNVPYLHTRMRSGNTQQTVTEVLRELGFAPGAVLMLEVLGRGELRLATVEHRGRWPIGRFSDEHQSSAPTRAPAPTRPTAQPKPEPRVTRPGSSRFPFTDRAAVLRLAEEYWRQISPRDRESERAFEQRLPAVRLRGWLDKELFVELARWKSVRKTPNYLANSEEQVRSLSQRAMNATSDDEAIGALVELDGVGLRTATALLHWLRPDHFPILDVRVIAALGETSPSSWESTSYYHRIAERVRDLATSLRVDLRTLDRALWVSDKLGSRSSH